MDETQGTALRPQKWWEGKKARIIIFATTAVVILGLTGVGAYVYLHRNNQPQNNSQTTAKAGNQASQKKPAAATYPIVDTAQAKCYDNTTEITCPTSGEFYGQDGSYQGSAPSCKDNGDGTITDNVTGLMWVKDPGAKLTYDKAVAGVGTCQSLWPPVLLLCPNNQPHQKDRPARLSKN